MYYDNKSSFYFKQYGVPILAITLSIILIGAGSFIYWSSSTTNALSLKAIDESAVQILGKNLANLKVMQTSDEGIIKEINHDGSIVFELNELAITLQMIGIDTTKVPDNYIQSLREDLVGKTATIAFDKEKIVDGNVFAYVYVNNNLYNEYVLDNGLANLRKETVNTTLSEQLKQAQAYAKQLSKGIWKKQ